jgi:phosphoribosylamine--glycine ligase/phosphoribosylformylglycinamidine cyclo-ligase
MPKTDLNSKAKEGDMRVLLVGSGAREHAIAWKLGQSPSLKKLFCAPGNAGTAQAAENVGIAVSDVEGLVGFAISNDIDLVVCGPELPLSLGLSDLLARRGGPDGPRCFGPGQAAAKIESSKSFSKALMENIGIPTAEYRVFDELDEAKVFIGDAPWPYVIKASGLASGKGVFLPDSYEEACTVLEDLMKKSSLGQAGSEVLIEERLEGEEVSILGFCDGVHVSVMPPTQDHKRLLEGDLGPNTGGMGAIASAHLRHMDMAQTLSRKFLEPVCMELASKGTPFVGVLYAGLMLTKKGPKALEYNCRFGDPEAEAILPLLETDLLRILWECTKTSLDTIDMAWHRGASACIVVADGNYATDMGQRPARLFKDFGKNGNSQVFHGATHVSGKETLAEGGRLLCVSSFADDVPMAIEKAYGRLARLDLPDSRFRKDIGYGRNLVKSLDPMGEYPGLRKEASGSDAAESQSAFLYADSGVDIEAGDRAVAMMSAAVRSTYGKEVLAGIGSFGGIYSAESLKGMKEPVLVASTDGVGTKVKLASLAGSFGSIGKDIVNHCIDDILVQGARPLFFLDYVATSKLDPSMVAQIVGGMSDACVQARCALLGGETAEMPGVYLPGEFDLAGTIVGMAEREDILPCATLLCKDILVGLPSSGLHTNGFSLARKIFPESELAGYSDILGRTLLEALLEPHRSYLPILEPVLSKAKGLVKALVHITGGGFEGNIPRILPSSLDAVVRPAAWVPLPVFDLIRKKGQVSREEMYRVFNMGIGMIAILDPARYAEFTELAKQDFPIIGYLKEGSGQAVLDFEGSQP